MSTLDIINARNAIVTFVSEDEVKTYTSIEANKAVSTIKNHIIVSQDLHIKKNLGVTLYDKLFAEWVANGQIAANLPDGTISGTPPIIPDDTTDYKELYEYIFKPLIWWSYTLALSSIAIKAGEAGLIFRSTDNAESAGIEGLRKITAESEAIARAYTDELIRYIESTFCEDQDFQKESEITGAPSMGIFVPKKPWHGNNENF